MNAQEQLRLDLMHARTDLVFLLSAQVVADADEIRNMRRRVSQLLEAISRNQCRVSSEALSVRATGYGNYLGL